MPMVTRVIDKGTTPPHSPASSTAFDDKKNTFSMATYKVHTLPNNTHIATPDNWKESGVAVPSPAFTAVAG